jgi:hypothetical protein
MKNSKSEIILRAKGPSGLSEYVDLNDDDECNRTVEGKMAKTYFFNKNFNGPAVGLMMLSALFF